MAQAFNLVADSVTPNRGSYAYIPNTPHTHKKER